MHPQAFERLLAAGLIGAGVAGLFGLPYASTWLTLVVLVAGPVYVVAGGYLWTTLAVTRVRLTFRHAIVASLFGAIAMSLFITGAFTLGAFDPGLVTYGFFSGLSPVEEVWLFFPLAFGLPIGVATKTGENDAARATCGLALAWCSLPAALFVVIATTSLGFAFSVAIILFLGHLTVIIVLGLPLYVVGHVSAVADASARTDAGVVSMICEHSELVTLGFLGVGLFGIRAVAAAGYGTAALLLSVLALIVSVGLLILAVRDLRNRLASM
ncbi:hypothetical protein BRC90_07995 [Halobacteriales archaeon QS_4_69_34]|nr:MAG: hypothetical protein BRC90_07995 [Halobacteriales archaeon QS_4_69_34]